MHHKHDVSSKDVFSITDMAAGIFFWKFSTISKEAAKRYILSPQITFSSSSLFLLIRLRLPSPGWDGNLRLKRRKNEEKEKVKWGDKMCLFAYDAKFSTKNPSGHIYDIKGIFWAYIMFMVHIPFNLVISLTTFPKFILAYYDPDIDHRYLKFHILLWEKYKEYEQSYNSLTLTQV